MKKATKKIEAKTKKVTRRKKKAKPQKLIGMEMEQIYAIINITQIKRIEQEIIIEPISAPMIENILKDCQIKFTIDVKPDGYHYTMQPPPERKIPDEAFIFPEELEDELKDDDFCL